MHGRVLAHVCKVGRLVYRSSFGQMQTTTLTIRTQVCGIKA